MITDPKMITPTGKFSTVYKHPARHLLIGCGSFDLRGNWRGRKPRYSLRRLPAMPVSAALREKENRN